MPIIREWAWAECPSRRRLRLLLRAETIGGKTVAVPPAVGGIIIGAVIVVDEVEVDRVARDAAIVRGRVAAVHGLGGDIGIGHDREVQRVVVAVRGGDIAVVVLDTGGVDPTVDRGGISPRLVERGRAVDIMMGVPRLKTMQVKVVKWG